MDQIADLLIRIKNAYLAKLKETICPASKMKEEILRILKDKRFISDYERRDNVLVIKLLYEGKKPAMRDVQRISKPGRRIYAGYSAIPKVMSGLGICILSTSKGVVSDSQARKLKAGGELICKIW